MAEMLGYDDIKEMVERSVAARVASDPASVREYIGMRYIPIFGGEWDKTKGYEHMVVVTYQGNSYTSTQAVPPQIEITNTTYWVLSANYNAQVEQYRQEVERLAGELAEAQTDLQSLTTEVTTLSDNFNNLGAAAHKGVASTIAEGNEDLPTSDLVDSALNIIKNELNNITTHLTTEQVEITPLPTKPSNAYALCFRNGNIVSIKIFTGGVNPSEWVNIYSNVPIPIYGETSFQVGGQDDPQHTYNPTKINITNDGILRVRSENPSGNWLCDTCITYIYNPMPSKIYVPEFGNI